MAWLKICDAESIPRLGSTIVKKKELEIGIFRNSNDEYFALNNHCPHKGGPLSQGIVFENFVACPLHNWKINLVTGEAEQPDEGKTECFKIKVEDKFLYIEID
ncbi:MAG: nitrite reductase small subunit NirD [Nitrosomonadales bacterium]|jgi:nitrite reductase (NADH) small subunit|nr:nitrite reductase small subunit NirD [Nitrosomonadales bacterium]MBT3918511.1 nitrite reductase small subunit NirD [Nitrosomonadales bacterium]MBT4182891.1 nitrite reductase small subunit NirD [Nitrosomonadales bacterium]MBT4570659.1 nitrite reductase small subunit NirD [Nitrosomonadales bacterium]MBT4759756.1 nitrite reductase small subunit NirD [Nitrosomonadales bacterium]